MESINCLNINHSVVKKVFYKYTLPQTPFFLFPISVIIPRCVIRRPSSSSSIYAIKSYKNKMICLKLVILRLALFIIGILWLCIMDETYDINFGISSLMEYVRRTRLTNNNPGIRNKTTNSRAFKNNGVLPYFP